MKNNHRGGVAVIAILCVAIVLSAVLIPLYFTGVIGREIRVKPSASKEEREVLDPSGNFFSAKSVSALPKGQYADFTLVCGEKTYSVKVYLHSDLAPKTVDNFVKYAKQGLYDGTVFYHGDITYDEKGKPSSAYIQGGAYTTGEDGTLVRKTPDEYYGKIKGEFLANDPETKNNVSFVAGTLAMVRDEEDYDSADTEFFFLSYAHPEYNGYYAAFGTVVESDDISELYTCTQELVKADGEYPVILKSVKITTRK